MYFLSAHKRHLPLERWLFGCCLPFFCFWVHAGTFDGLLRVVRSLTSAYLLPHGCLFVAWGTSVVDACRDLRCAVYPLTSVYLRPRECLLFVACCMPFFCLGVHAGTFESLLYAGYPLKNVHFSRALLHVCFCLWMRAETFEGLFEASGSTKAWLLSPMVTMKANS